MRMWTSLLLVLPKFDLVILAKAFGLFQEILLKIYKEGYTLCYQYFQKFILKQSKITCQYCKST